MANADNLINVNELNARLTPEERQENAKKAGKASVEAKRKRKALKEELEALLSLKKDEKTYQEHMSLALIEEALKGSTKAFEVIRDTIGEKPKEKIEHSGNVNNPFTNLSTEELRQLIKDE